MDSLSWQSDSPLWDLIGNTKQIPHYEDIALVSGFGGAPMSNINQKFENNSVSYKGRA